jgi:aarF domain-containing kinase
MAGKRLLDVAALFNASRGVAQQHVALRRRQLEVWNKTSSVAKAVKNQTDRVTETAKAASFLASRLNESPPAYTAEPSTSTEQTPTSGQERPQYNGSPTRASSETPTVDLSSKNDKSLSSKEAKRLQRQFERQIPSQPAGADDSHSNDRLVEGHDEDSFYTRSDHGAAPLSSLPRVKIPKHISNVQGNDEHVNAAGINSDTYSSPVVGAPTVGGAIPTRQAIQEQDQISEGVNTELFYSPRIARMLGGSAQRGRKISSEIEVTQHKPSRAISDINPETFPTPASFAKETTAVDKTNVTVAELDRNVMQDSPQAADILSSPASSTTPYEMRESRIPSSRIGRLWNYGGLAAGMFGGAISESLRRATGSGGEGSYMLSAANMDRLVAKLSRMRGAALKLGQMMSFQDSKMLPAPIQQVLLRVQDSADYMPPSQRDKVLVSNLGPDWRDLFTAFEEKPMAAASIGQVHAATLKSTGERVAVKVQYPGVADSIDSDLSNLAVLLTASRLLPKGLYLDKTIANARTELAWECDYLREAECGRRFQDLLSDESDVFVVPKIFPEASGPQVLTMEFMEGVGVTKVQNFTQAQKDWIGTQILRLCLREIIEFRFMQTDPNWTNFLYNTKTNRLELLDFGASREYPGEFMSRYIQLLLAASKSDKDTVRTMSIELGYLTGHESKAMLDAHIASVLTLAEPFLASSPEVYDFQDQTITERVKALIPVMIRERLAPPPEETYSLHRKLSGAFLLCARLGSRVPCRELFENSMSKAGLV